MSKTGKHIDEFLSKALSEAPETGLDLGWESFEKKRLKKRRAALLLWSAAAVLLIGLGGWLMFGISGESTPEVAVHQTPEKPQKEQPEIQIQTDQPQESEKKTDIEQAHKNLTGNRLVNAVRAHTIDESGSPIVKPQSVKPKRKGPELVTISARPFSFNWVTPQHNVIRPSWTKIYLESPVVRSDSNIDEVKPRWFVELSAGPTWLKSGLSEGANTASMTHKDYRDIRNQSELGVMGAQANVSIGRSFGRLIPRIGLRLSQNQVAANYNFTVSENPVLDVDGTVIGYRKISEKNVRFSNRHTYIQLDVPLGLDFEIGTIRRQSFGLTAACAAQMLMSVNGETPNPLFLDRRWALKNANFNLQSWSVEYGAYYIYQLNPNSCIYVRPMAVFNNGFKQVAGLYKSQLDYLTLNFGFRKSL